MSPTQKAPGIIDIKKKKMLKKSCQAINFRIKDLMYNVPLYHLDVHLYTFWINNI